jgi:hypothetical protein
MYRMLSWWSDGWTLVLLQFYCLRIRYLARRYLEHDQNPTGRYDNALIFINPLSGLG